MEETGSETGMSSVALKGKLEHVIIVRGIQNTKGSSAQKGSLTSLVKRSGEKEIRGGQRTDNIPRLQKKKRRAEIARGRKIILVKSWRPTQG